MIDPGSQQDAEAVIEVETAFCAAKRASFSDLDSTSNSAGLLPTFPCTLVTSFALAAKSSYRSNSNLPASSSRADSGLG